MGSLTALLVATPIFGLSLQVPGMHPAPDLSLQVAARLSASAGSGSEAEEVEGESYAEQMKERNGLADLHRPFGIATWGAMTVTTVLGFIQYYNLYGFFANQQDNPCVEGSAIFGQGQCWGTPWLHLGAASVTTALYATTFTLASLMPDPDNLAEGPGEFASTLRLHKLLRWVHFGGMVAQVVLGILVANSKLIGLDRANDYGTLQALATVHLASGLVSYGALTWAGALMTF
ncbi:MAG: hypothetical protein OXU20_10870 [Myxococcales bacterium]|nr:hypothetical protein [Myxococcales bacterium]MDD9967290.1 hypothetical protein [Myxococcales bacterium]